MYTKYNYMYMCKSIFSEMLMNTCEHKIKSFTIEQKHLNKLILYKYGALSNL